MSDSKEGLSGPEWLQKLHEISSNLHDVTELCLMGSATNVFEGQEARMTIDLDVWRRRSKFNPADLQAAVEKAGLLYNPTDYIEPDRPYLQIVEPGVAHCGEFTAAEQLLPGEGKLKLTRPPIANLIAAKLCRASARDIEDIGFLVRKFPDVTRSDVERALRTFPPQLRANARENLVFFSLQKETASPEVAR